MPNPWTDDMYYDQPDDPNYGDNQEMWDTAAAFNEGYETASGVQARVDEGQISPNQLYNSEFRINDDGTVRPITETERFLRNNKMLLGLIALGWWLI